MLAINMADVVNVLNTCKPYLIGFAAVLVLALIVIIAVHKMKKRKPKTDSLGSRNCNIPVIGNRSEYDLLWTNVKLDFTGNRERNNHRRDFR